MLRHRLVALTGCVLIFGGPAFGAVEAPVAEVPPRVAHSCDSVCQLHAQDWAFALLIETYREYRCNQIEAEYGRRTRAVAGLSAVPDDSGVVHAPLRFVQQLQELLGDVAAAERNRGLQLIHTQVNNFQSLYDCARKRDEEALGVMVAKTVDSRAVVRELKQYLVVQPDPVANTATPADAHDLRHVMVVSPKYLSAHAMDAESEPASSLLFDEPAVPADPNLLLGPCQ